MIDRAASPLLVRVLGPLDIQAGGRVTTLGSARQREVLAVLVVHAGQVVATDALIDALWGDVPPPSAAHTLQGLVSRLRSVLGGAAIVAHAPGYLLSLSAATIDVQLFEDLATQARNAARAGQAGAALELFDAALALWRGDAFGEFGDRPFAQAEACRIQELRATVTEDRADVLLASRPPSELVGDLEAAARAEPYRERRQGQLMVALARSGRPVDATRSYERFRRRLSDEVGVVPSRSLHRLNDEILSQAPGTEWSRGPDPPVRAPDAARLPRPVTSFVGRADDMMQVAEAVRACGLVTVCGPAGVGKTRLALEVGRMFDASEPPRDGVWWCDLSPVVLGREGDGDHGVAAVIGTALGASPGRGQPMREGVLNFLATKDLMLVLDNCEQIVGPVAELAAGILQRAPGVAMLATSREPLAIEGERVIDLDPLGEHDAARLFAERAAAIRVGFALDADNEDDVAEICRRLDGIPLAVELAAGRLKSLGVTDLAALLDDRFRVLVTNRRDAPDRHRTLRAAIDSSYDSLSSDERAVFDRLAVFPASFGLDAAEAVCADGSVAPADVLELLSRLVTRSLVVAVPDDRGAVRYRLLESLRTYALERLATMGEASMRSAYRRHAEHYAALVAEAAPEIAGPDETRWLTWLVTELPNLSAAVHRAAADGDVDLAASLFIPLPVWMWCGSARSVEIGSWARLLVGQPAIEAHPAYARICEWGLRAAVVVGGPDLAEWTQRVTAPGFTPTALTICGQAYQMFTVDPGEASTMFLHAADMARASGDRFTESVLLLHVSPAPTADLEHTRRVSAASQASGSPTAIAWSLLGVAMNSAWSDREAALAAIDELPRQVARCALPDTNLQHSAEYARALLQLVEGDVSGLRPIRSEIVAMVAISHGPMLTLHLLRLVPALLHLGVCDDAMAELIAGIRAQRFLFTLQSEETADLLRVRMGDVPYDAAVRRGAALTLDQLGDRALGVIDQLLLDARTP